MTPTFTGTFPTDGEPYVEGDPYEYPWDVPNDYPALFSLLGGNAKVRPMLEQYLSQPNGFGMYAQLTNEFDFGEQFALDYAGDPAGTQKAVNNIRNTMYLPGTGRAGQQRRPRRQQLVVRLGDARHVSGELGHAARWCSRAPASRSSIHLANGHTININAPGASPSTYYVKSLRLDGGRTRSCGSTTAASPRRLA